MPVTAKDIANELGLSQSTVSRILNGDQNHRVSDATRERVLEAARRLEYHPNAVARSLRQGRTHLVGFYDTWANETFNAGHEFLGRIIGGLQRSCGARGYDLLLHSPRRGQVREEVYGKLSDGRIDGLVLHGDCSDTVVARLVGGALPLVAIVDFISHVPSVVVDDEQGARELAEYLWGRGYRRYAFVEHRPINGGPLRRRQAFANYLQERGIMGVPALGMDYDMAAPPLDELLALQQWQPETPLAVFCWNDVAAYNLLRACLERGVRVPEQLAIVGFDGFLDTKLPAMQLVTVNCPWDEVASIALELLLRRIEGEEVPLETRLPTNLIAGNTA